MLRFVLFVSLFVSGLLLSSCMATADLGRARQSQAPLVESQANSDLSESPSSYDNETIQFIIPFARGGGTDVWARTIAPGVQKHLGRNARIEVLNQPGNSGVDATNRFFAEHDSQTILVTSGSIFFPYLLGDESVAYEFNNLVPILGSPVGGIVFVSPQTGIESVTDLCLVETPLRYAGISASGLDIVPLIAFELLGIEIDATFGYDGKGASRVAFEQGQADIEYQTTPGYLANQNRLVDVFDARPLFTFGILSNQGDVIRDPAFPDLPTVKEVFTICRGDEPSGVAWDIYKAILAAGVTIQKVMWIHGETPEDAIAELRQAAEAVVTDPEFSESAQNLLGAYDFFVGHEAQVTFAAASNLSPESISWLKSLLNEKYAGK